MSERKLLTWIDGMETKPIAMLAWGDEYDERGSVLTRDADRIRAVCAGVALPWGSYQKATFPEGIEGLEIWTADKVIHVGNGDDGHVFEILSRNPPDEPEREWGASAAVAS
ncbi:hypothetical protein [Methylobacterium sp. WL120]|uniref:hypothetical protein n=1 Tax=Methylobacterium sp. WL120 TaxID=2603887 RepID=UPI0011CC27C5|nr:hypothetical protein [Methylobacterium sp. WL120]TXM65402.1 hypothetical protein FV229_15640 [Methylobacterium sp. WL120]